MIGGLLGRFTFHRFFAAAPPDCFLREKFAVVRGANRVHVVDAEVAGAAQDDVVGHWLLDFLQIAIHIEVKESARPRIILQSATDV